MRVSYPVADHPHVVVRGRYAAEPSQLVHRTHISDCLYDITIGLIYLHDGLVQVYTSKSDGPKSVVSDPLKGLALQTR